MWCNGVGDSNLSGRSSCFRRELALPMRRFLLSQAGDQLTATSWNLAGKTGSTPWRSQLSAQNSCLLTTGQGQLRP